MNKGYVYVLTNPTMPGLVKIGKTKLAVEKRIKDLSRSTGVPLPFEKAYEFETHDRHILETEVHRALSNQRLNGGREFFEISVVDAVDTIKQVAKRFNLELVAPEPVAPEPVAPEPVAPEPVAPEPVAPEPSLEEIKMKKIQEEYAELCRTFPYDLRLKAEKAYAQETAPETAQLVEDVISGRKKPGITPEEEKQQRYKRMLFTTEYIQTFMREGCTRVLSAMGYTWDNFKNESKIRTEVIEKVLIDFQPRLR